MLATLRLGVVGSVAAALVGCVYIGNETLINKSNCIDEDGDGVPRAPQEGSEFEFQCPGPDIDCDDSDPERYPGSAEVPHREIPYDRIDQDCDPARVDLVDVDGDTFPGISRAEWDAITRESGDPAGWPAGVVDGNTAVGKDANFDCDDDPAGDDASDNIPDAANVNPKSKEAYGDGIDQDCSCLDTKGVCDDYDSDGDGYVIDAYAKDSTLPAGDCDDSDPDINPGVDPADDVPYDGIDSDCDGTNDFDIDGDGYMPDAPGSMKQADWQEMFFQFCRTYGWADAKAGADPSDYVSCYEELYGVSTAPEWGDCADSEDDMPSGTSMTSDEVYPGASDDYYDGVDGDCNQDNDFDADGDLYIDVANTTDYENYVSFWGIKSHDCHDASGDRLSCEDGIDNNKDGTTDNNDPLCKGTSSLGIEGAPTYGICAGSDCDDLDAAIHPNDVEDDRPGVMEILGDALDQDCDKGKNTTLWQYGGYGWDEPRNVVVGRNERDFMLSTGATNTDAAVYKNAGLALLFKPTDAVDDPVDDSTTWFVSQTNQTAQTIGGRVDMISTIDGFYAALSYVNVPTCAPEPCTLPPPSTYTMVKKVYWDTAYNDYRNKIVYRQISTIRDTYPDIDLRLDGNSNVWAFGAGPQTLAYVVGDSSSAFNSRSKGCYGAGNCDAGTILPANPTQSFIDPPAAGQTLGKGTVCNGTACTTYDLDGGTATGTVSLSVTQPYATQAYGFTGVDWQNGYRTIVPPSGTGVEVIKDGSPAVDILTSFQVRAAAVDESAGKLYIVAVVSDQNADGKDDVLVAYGPATGTTFTTAIMPLIIDDGVNAYTFDPNEVSIYADADRVMIGVSGEKTGSGCLSPTGTLCDIVAWAFMGPQG